MTSKKKFFSLLSFFLSLTFILGVSFTYAAYLNSDKFNQNYNVNMSYIDCFDVNDPENKSGDYKISTSTHLRNLSKLTNIGCFKPTDKFTLTKDIVWSESEEALFPIGNMHSPFCSIFEGNGKTISNLKVLAYDTADVGMFGYISKTGKVQNFILDQPTVISDTKSPNYSYMGTANNIDNNPLREIFTPDICRSIKLTPIYATENNDKSGMASFSIDLPEVANEKLLNFSEYKLVISDESSFNVTQYGNANNGNVFKIDYVKPADSTIKDIYYTIGIKFNALISLNGTNDLRFVNFYLEEFELFYNGTNLVTDPLDAHKYTKNFYPDPVRGEDIHGISGYSKNQHLINCGILCGSFCGTAQYILAYQPKLQVLGRPFSSNSILFGRHYEDDNKSTISSESLKVNETYKNKDKLTYKYENEFLLDKDIPPENQNTGNSLANSEVQFFQKYKYQGKYHWTPVYTFPDIKSNEYAAEGIGNRYVADVYSTNESTFRKITENTIKIYDTNDNSVYLDGDTGADANNTNTPHGVSLKTIPVKDLGDQKFISFHDDLECYMTYTTNTRDHYNSFGYQYVSCSNGIRIWTRSENENKNWWQNLISDENRHILLNFNFDYLFFDENKLSSPNAKQSYSDVELKLFVTKKLNKQFWNGIADTTMNFFYEGNRNNSGNPSPDTWMTTDGMRYPPNVDYHDYCFSSGAFHGHKPSDMIDSAYRVWALDRIETDGIHKANNELDPNVKVKLKDGKNPLLFQKDEISGDIPDLNNKNGYELLNKSFSLDIKAKFLKGINAFDNSDRTPVIYFGLASKDKTPYSYTTKTDENGNTYIDTETPRVPTGGYSFNIANFNITFSDVNGNVLGTIASVDFGDDSIAKPTYDGFTWDNTWPKSSGIKVGVNLFDNFQAGSTVSTPNIEVKTNAQNITTYTIFASRNNAVKIKYNIIGASIANDIIPFNNPGFKSTSISYDQNL